MHLVQHDITFIVTVPSVARFYHRLVRRGSDSTFSPSLAAMPSNADLNVDIYVYSKTKGTMHALVRKQLCK